MMPFQLFRRWTRRAPVGERAAAGVASVVVLGLVVWLLVPTNKSSTDVDAGLGTTGQSAAVDSQASSGGSSTTAVTVAGGTSATDHPGGTGAVGGGTGNAVGSGSTSDGSGPKAASGACASPPGGDQGISDSAVKIAVTILSIAGPAGNGTFGVPSPQELKEDYQLVADAINAAGGVACRKLELQFYEVNGADPTDQQQKCLSILASKPFAVVDTGSYFGTNAANCFPQNKLPFFASGLIAEAQINQFYPYIFGGQSEEVLYRNTVMALKDIGFFDPGKGFKKLGFVYRSCWPDLVKSFLGWLSQAGVPSSQLVTYDVGCPSAFANPADLQQAVLKFKTNGVTQMTSAHFFSDFSNFTKIAEQQGFRPKYGIADDSIVATTRSNLAPDLNNIADAIAISSSRYDELSTAVQNTPATAKCNAIFTSHGRPTVEKQGQAFGGVACDQLWMLSAAIAHMPSMQRSSLAAGLQAAKSVDFSYPFGPNDFSAPKAVYGGQFWRPVRFFADCKCWKATDTTWHPKFP